MLLTLTTEWTTIVANIDRNKGDNSYKANQIYSLRKVLMIISDQNADMTRKLREGDMESFE